MNFDYRRIRVKDIYTGRGAFDLFRPSDCIGLEEFTDNIRNRIGGREGQIVFDPPVVIHTQRGFAIICGWNKIEWAKKALEPVLYAIVAEPEELPA